MTRIIRPDRSTNRHPRRLADLIRAWGPVTGRDMYEYESSRYAHSHAIARLAQEAQR